MHASYYILYILGEVARRKNIDLTLSSFQDIWDLYQGSVSIIEEIISKEKKVAGQEYTHSTFFRSNKSKKYFEELEDAELKRLMNIN